MIHHIQRHILDSLATVTSARYSDLKPVDLDGNTFTYHLKRLLSERYIEQTESSTYCLTQRGITYVVHRYEDPAMQAHSIFLIVLKVGSQWLLRERLVQPLIHQSGFIHGEPRHDEPIVATARRRLLEKTGIDTELSVRTSGVITLSTNDELQSYSHAVIIYGETLSIPTTLRDATGRNFFAGNLDDASLNLLPSCRDIVDTIASNQPWFELHYELNQ